MFNHGLIRFIRFVSRFTYKLYNAFFILSKLKSPYKCPNFFLKFWTLQLKKRQVSRPPKNVVVVQERYWMHRWSYSTLPSCIRSLLSQTQAWCRRAGDIQCRRVLLVARPPPHPQTPQQFCHCSVWAWNGTLTQFPSCRKYIASQSNTHSPFQILDQPF